MSYPNITIQNPALPSLTSPLLTPAISVQSPMSLEASNRLKQLVIQQRLLDIALGHLPYIERRQVNPSLTEEMLRLSVATGLATPNLTPLASPSLNLQG